MHGVPAAATCLETWNVSASSYAVRGAPRCVVLATLLLIGCAQGRGPASDNDPPSTGAADAGSAPAELAAAGIGGAGSAGTAGCAVQEVARQSLRLDGAPVYVNAQAFSVSGERVLLAGVPNYVWLSAGDSGKRDASPESIFGVVVDRDGTVTAVPNPMQGHLNYPYAVARPGGGWRIVFMELAQSIREEISPEVLGLWSGVFDGDEWSELERLPMPKDYEIDDPEEASLLRSGDTVAFAVTADPAGQVLLFERVGGHWSWERVTVPSNKRYPEPVTVSHLALIPWRRGPALLVNKEYGTIDSIYNSLFLYAREPGWREHKVVTSVERFVTSQFSVSPGPPTDVVTWVFENEVFAYVGDLESGRLSGFTVDTSATRGRVGLSGITSRVIKLANGTPLWVTQPRTPNESGRLRFFVGTGDSATLIGTSVEEPAWRLQAIRTAPSGLILIGAEFRSEGEDGLISSVLLRFRAQCAAFRH